MQNSQNFTQLIWQRFKKNRSALWALRGFILLLLVAILGTFLTNERPIFCTLIPYSATTQDAKNRDYRSPLGVQEVENLYHRHWLGTDNIGRDVAAGLVAGTSIALLIGFGAMLVAGSIGVFLGVLAGFFSDYDFKTTLLSVFINSIGVFLAYFWAFISRAYLLVASENILVEYFISIFIFIITILVFNYLYKKIKNIFSKKHILMTTISFPMDTFVMRLVEIFNSIPRLLLILAIAAIVQKSSIWHLAFMIGVVSWTTIAKFTRAEMLRIRSLSYIEAARALGLKNWQIILRHALPNALAPLLITLAFGMASAVLLEGFLSFLGIGLSVEQVTWGSMLAKARENFGAWWLAFFPGMMIAISVIIFNLIGDGLNEALENKN